MNEYGCKKEFLFIQIKMDNPWEGKLLNIKLSMGVKKFIFKGICCVRERKRNEKNSRIK
jgi:hypothetical protein